MDINDISCLAIIAQYCSGDNEQKELCCLSPIYGSTKGADILEKFINHFKKRQIDIKKIFVVTTDGAVAMVGRDHRFLALIEEKNGHPVMKFYCIIHQERLCAKILNSNLASVIATTTKLLTLLLPVLKLFTGNFILFLMRWRVHRDLLLHCTSRWLSCGKVFVRIVESLDEINIFLSNQGKHYPELNDEKWFVDLLFLTDITTHLNELNLLLQGAGQTVLDLSETWKSFATTLDVYIFKMFKVPLFVILKIFKNFRVITKLTFL